MRSGAMHFHLPTVLGVVLSMAGGSQYASLRISDYVCNIAQDQDSPRLPWGLLTSVCSCKLTPIPCLPQLHIPTWVSLIWNYIYLCPGVLKHAFTSFECILYCAHVGHFSLLRLLILGWFFWAGHFPNCCSVLLPVSVACRIQSCSGVRAVITLSFDT